MSSSSSSSSPEEEVEQGGDFDEAGPSSSSSSRRRRRMSSRSSKGSVWPEPFVEALAFHVALDAALHVGRLAAAQALFNIFQVCSTWRSISSSDLLWQNLTRSIWNVPHLTRATWREEFIHRHRTATNFRLRRCTHTTLHHIPSEDQSCRRLAISGQHLAAGFSDGAVRLFHLPSGLHVSTFFPYHRDRLGRFSRSVAGVVLNDTRLVFATLDGDVHEAGIDGVMTPLRRVHMGDVVNDGCLVDFDGSDRWWVGLYAGVPGRAFHIWNSETEELLFIGGTLTDPEALTGWHSLTEMTDLIGRVRVTCHNTAVACTRHRLIVFDLHNQGVVLGEREFRRGGVTVGSFDSNDESVMVSGSLRRLVDLEEVCRFNGRERMMMGCLNGGYGVVYGGGVIRVWEIERGEFMYSFRERIGECSAIVADDRYVAAASDSCAGILHVWDFGPQ